MTKTKWTGNDSRFYFDQAVLDVTYDMIQSIPENKYNELRELFIDEAQRGHITVDNIDLKRLHFDDGASAGINYKECLFQVIERKYDNQLVSRLIEILLGKDYIQKLYGEWKDLETEEFEEAVYVKGQESATAGKFDVNFVYIILYMYVNGIQTPQIEKVFLYFRERHLAGFHSEDYVNLEFDFGEDGFLKSETYEKKKSRIRKNLEAITEEARHGRTLEEYIFDMVNIRPVDANGLFYWQPPDAEFDPTAPPEFASITRFCSYNSFDLNENSIPLSQYKGYKGADYEEKVSEITEVIDEACHDLIVESYLRETIKRNKQTAATLQAIVEKSSVLADPGKHLQKDDELMSPHVINKALKEIDYRGLLHDIIWRYIYILRGNSMKNADKALLFRGALAEDEMEQEGYAYRKLKTALADERKKNEQLQEKCQRYLEKLSAASAGGKTNVVYKVDPSTRIDLEEARRIINERDVEIERLKARLALFQEENNQLWESANADSTDLSEEAPDSAHEMLAKRMLFVVQNDVMKSRLSAWFPGSLISDDFDGNMNLADVDLVVVMTKSIAHKEAYRILSRCKSANIPFIYCNKVNQEQISNTIIAYRRGELKKGEG